MEVYFLTGQMAYSKAINKEKNSNELTSKTRAVATFSVIIKFYPLFFAKNKRWRLRPP
jgi:hypothetical protein